MDECVLTCETKSMPTTLRVEMRLGRTPRFRAERAVGGDVLGMAR